MAEDIKMKYDSDLREFDIEYKNGDLVRELGLETAVYMSLFTDRRASEDDPVDDIKDLRGWWGDGLNETEDEDLIGSKLWILARAKTTSETASLAKQYIEEAMQWMLDDDVAASINVEVSRQNRKGQEGTGADSDVLAFKLQILKNDGDTVTFKFDDLWGSQFGIETE